MSDVISQLKQAASSALKSRQFETAVDVFEQLIGAIARGGASALPAPVAPIVQTAIDDATKLGVDTTNAEIEGNQAPGTVAAQDAGQLAKDVLAAFNTELQSALGGGLLGDLVSKAAATAEATVMARFVPTAAK